MKGGFDQGHEEWGSHFTGRSLQAEATGASLVVVRWVWGERKACGRKEELRGEVVELEKERLVAVLWGTEKYKNNKLCQVLKVILGSSLAPEIICLIKLVMW